MTYNDDDKYDEPPYWWQDEGAGSDLLRAAWDSVGRCVELGLEAKITFRKPRQPTITIAFDWDETDDDVLEED